MGDVKGAETARMLISSITQNTRLDLVGTELHMSFDS